MTPHAPAIAVKDLASHRYSFRNHSYAFACPVCGLTKRYNANYLGRRVITCDGEKFTLTRPATDAILGGGL